MFMCVVHSHRGPLGPYMGPHTLHDPVVGSHIFGVWAVGLVGWLGLGLILGLVGAFVGVLVGDGGLP